MTGKKYSFVMQFKVECPYCDKEIDSYGDEFVYCRDCEVAFKMQIFEAKHERINENQVKWWFGEQITEMEKLE